MTALGRFWETGLGGPQDIPEAIRCYEKVKDQDPHALARWKVLVHPERQEQPETEDPDSESR
jgi:TPR repeat protein